MKKPASFLKYGLVFGLILTASLYLAPTAQAGSCTCASGGGLPVPADTAGACDQMCGASNMGAGIFTTDSSPTITPNTGSTQLENPLASVCGNAADGQVCVQKIIGNIIKWAFGIVGSIALLMIIWGGMQWLTSMGNSDKVEKGKNTLIWASIGLVIIFGAYTIASFVITALGTPAKKGSGTSGPVTQSQQALDQTTPQTCKVDADCSDKTKRCIADLCM